ncbi:SIMPL domain-containing protein [Neisseria sp. ZJ106]|uniref:SIMPL domain-containing protein n=1 Tax=Neisseria lisongii TaxID=2912188 RepID=A0ABY7RI54_9NEIS|nr:SIMPL domain-containing protein [Neisseria lisongii]MCF7520765.1 SIMPL domain-containing protein [Neisseria lisongii]WCL70705.1 SIMPL domain-containing protein [Neisseria lisongii]
MLKHAVTACLLAAALPAVAEPLNYNVVEFSESANIEVARDTMTARFQVRAEGKDREAVNSEFTKKFNSFSKKAQNSPFKSELISRHATPRYQYSNGKRTQTGWEEVAEFKVESKDFNALNRLIAAAQSDANLQYTSFSVSKQKRESVIDEVSKAAILRFKDRAQTLAQTLGHSSYKIVKLNLGHIGSQPVQYESAAAFKSVRAVPLAASADGGEIDNPTPGTEEISITVDGSIQM